MINSANTVDFNAISHGSVLLQSGMVPLDKCKIIHSSKIPQSANERFTSTYSIQTSLVSPFNNTVTVENTLRTDNEQQSESETKDIHIQPQRVQVQHLQIHPNLQNNRWSYHTFYNISNEMERTSQDGGASRIINNNLISKESAFSLRSSVSVNSSNSSNSSNNTNYNNNNSNNSSNNNNNNNNNSNSSSSNNNNSSSSSNNSNNRNRNHNNISNPNTFKQIECGKSLIGNIAVRTIDEADAHRDLTVGRSSSVYNIDYQENAFLRIKDVHNYAKLDRYSYSNESSNSSLHDEENEDDDVDLDEDLDDNNDDAATNYERYLKNRKRFDARKDKSNEEAVRQSNTGDMCVMSRMEMEETEQNVDVETVHKVQNESEGGAVTSTPDHHARRPMNAFLIFCKRHRAIVKERYKSLENRAITKILGDWWASLDANDKKCFTNLAQQNKDAFFNANPNFKWYKLPAPPLRTLNTRPGNNEQAADQDDSMRSMIVSQSSDNILPKCANHRSGHFFKLADEAQMGELSTLMNIEFNNNNNNVNENENALQQALGETSQFLNAYMPPTSDTDCRQSNKMRLLSENSFSSNGSEEDIMAKKSSRACKGKIYQELINSGQITAVSKKVKVPKSQNHQNGFTYQTVNPSHSFSQISLDSSNNSAALRISKNNPKQSESFNLNASQPNNDISSFDLEEKIKVLPALSLDLYLQRKRNTKKKKKFTSKKRHTNSASNNTTAGAINIKHTSSDAMTSSKIREAPPQQAVGSQKRKARKESITRRDVTAIENEIASVIPLAKSFSTINGCYYFNESPDSTISKNAHLGENTIATAAADNQLTDAFVNLNNDNISSTSDLLILAEVAANRTELTN